MLAAQVWNVACHPCLRVKSPGVHLHPEVRPRPQELTQSAGVGTEHSDAQPGLRTSVPGESCPGECCLVGK